MESFPFNLLLARPAKQQSKRQQYDRKPTKTMEKTAKRKTAANRCVSGA